MPTLALFAGVVASGMPTAAASPARPLSPGPGLVASQSVYPVDEAARNFDTGPAGWRGSRENPPGCWLRGGSCPKIDTIWKAAGGPRGAGDGYLRFKGNSAAVNGFPWPQAASTVWQSPLFSYAAATARSWVLGLDWRSTYPAYAIGWNGLQVEIVDAGGQVLRTVMPGRVSVPGNRWSRVEVPFDGARLVTGRQYRLRVITVDYYGPSAATVGHHDIDNVAMAVGDRPAAEPVVKCRRDQVRHPVAVETLVTGDVGSLCDVTEPLGESLRPASAMVESLAGHPVIASMLAAGQGYFVLFDRAADRSAAWAVGRRDVLGDGSRRLYMYLAGGAPGRPADGALYFVVSNPERVQPDAFGHPGGLPAAIVDAVEGQPAAGEVLPDPVGEALDVDPAWGAAGVLWHITTVLGGRLSEGGLPIPLPDVPPARPDVPARPGLPGGDLPKVPPAPGGR